MDELKNEKENYKENSVINRKQTVNFRKGAFGEGVNTWAWKHLHVFQTKHSTCCNVDYNNNNNNNNNISVPNALYIMKAY